MNEDDRINKYLDKILEFEKAGYITEALQLANKLIKTFPEDKVNMLLEKAKLEFRNHYDKEALLDFIAVYEMSRDIQLYDLILEAYYLPNKEKMEQNYSINIKLLETYPHYRNPHEEMHIGIVPILIDDEMLICVNLDDKNFSIYIKNNKLIVEEKDQVAMLVNELWIDDIVICENCFRINSPFLDMNIPIYLVFDMDYWKIFLLLYSIENLIDLNRVVFLIDKTSLFNYLQEDEVMFPTRYYYNGYNEYEIVLKKAWITCNQLFESAKKDIEKYYINNAEQIIHRIKTHNSKIMFVTSRFTVALQYHIRDCMQAVEKLGHTTKLLIEQDGIHRVSDRYIIKCLLQFKPDIIFSIDHFRNEKICPKEIVYITWIQDKLQPTTGNQKIVNALSERDVVASAFISDLNGKQWGMDYKEALKLPISVNDSLYRHWDMSQNEKRQYECDICIVANATDYLQEIGIFMKSIPELVKRDCHDVINVYIDLMEQEQFFFGFEGNYQIIHFIISQLEINFNQKFIRLLSETIYYNIFYRRYKSLVAEWLIDHGYTNIKLYGNEWGNNEKFRPYAMGVIENGEKLSKALRASKIAIGLHPHVSLPARLIETIASGTFYIAHHIPEEFDLANAREYFKEGEELVYYYNKQDLLDKIHYYLNHDNEREKIVKAGQNRIAQDLTYEKILKRVIQETAQLIEKREEKENAHN